MSNSKRPVTVPFLKMTRATHNSFDEFIEIQFDISPDIKLSEGRFAFQFDKKEASELKNFLEDFLAQK